MRSAHKKKGISALSTVVHSHFPRAAEAALFRFLLAFVRGKKDGLQAVLMQIFFLTEYARRKREVAVFIPGNANRHFVLAYCGSDVSVFASAIQFASARMLIGCQTEVSLLPT